MRSPAASLLPVRGGTGLTHRPLCVDVTKPQKLESGACQVRGELLPLVLPLHWQWVPKLCFCGRRGGVCHRVYSAWWVPLILSKLSCTL